MVKTHKTADGKDEYDKLVIRKEDKNKLPIQGIKFCIVDTEKSTYCKEEYGRWVTDEKGKIEIPVNELPLYNTYLYEVESCGEPKGSIDESLLSKQKYTAKHIPLYVDPGNRFLGEVKGKDFIKYDELIATIVGEVNSQEKKYEVGDATNKIGEVLSKGNDTKTGGNWLKIYDAREGKTLYIAKKTLTNYVSWGALFEAGVVYGTDQIDINNIQEDGTIKHEEPYTGKSGYKPKIIKIKNSSGVEKKYIVRLLRGQNTKDSNKLSYRNRGLSVTGGSEWNRYIIPIVRDYRYGSSSGDNIEQELKYGGKDGYLGDLNKFKIQLATYNWFGDLTLGVYEGTYIYIKENKVAK